MADLDQHQDRVAPGSASRIGPLIAGCFAVAALSLSLPSALTFDPLTWATWAHEIAHLRLDTRGGPAWKPLPVLIDVAFSPFGPARTFLWLLVARAGGLLAVAMVYRSARRVAGRLSGVVAAAGMLLSESFLEYLTPLGMSEPLLAGLALVAIECHLDGRHGHAYALLYACLLLRPETFPFFLAYSVLMWRRHPPSRPWVVVLIALLPMLWLFPDYAGSGDWLRSPKRAAVPSQGGPLLTDHPGLAVLENAFNAVIVPVVAGAVIAMVLAVAGYLRRRRAQPAPGLSSLDVLCLVGLAWLVEEALVTQAQLGSGDQRYLIVAYAIGCVLAGVGWTRFAGMVSNRTLRIGVVGLIILGSAPFVWSRLDDLSRSAGDIPYQTNKYRELAVLISRAGGRERILACGPLTSDIYQMPAVAWNLDIHQSQIIIGVRPTGTVFRTRTTRRSSVLPPRLGSPDFRLLASTDQWQVLSTCGPAAR